MVKPVLGTTHIDHPAIMADAGNFAAWLEEAIEIDVYIGANPDGGNL